jgi:hypothetical protein
MRINHKVNDDYMPIFLSVLFGTPCFAGERGAKCSPIWCLLTKDIHSGPADTEKISGNAAASGRKSRDVLHFFTDIVRVCDYTDHKFL